MKLKNIVFVFIIILIINILIIPKTFAISDIIDSGNDFLNKGKSENAVIDEDTLKSTSSKIYNILLGIRNRSSRNCWSRFRCNIYSF